MNFFIVRQRGSNSNLGHGGLELGSKRCMCWGEIIMQASKQSVNHRYILTDTFNRRSD